MSYFSGSEPWPFALAVVLAAFIWRLSTSSSHAQPLPPGPPRLPLVGNVLDLPTKNMEAYYCELNRKYGDLVYLDALGQPILVLGTHEAAIDLLEKRSSLYSDRVHSAIVDLGGFDWVLTMLHYGPWWRRHRRAFHQFFNAAAVAQYEPLQRKQIKRFLLRLLSTPQDFSEHIRQRTSLFAATIMRIAYGIDVADHNDIYMTMAEQGLAAFSRLLVPGKYLVELLPSLRLLPRWAPGAQFKRDAAEVCGVVRAVRDVPWAHTRTAMKEGTANPSMATALFERIATMTDSEEAADEEKVVRNTVAVAYAAGADTTISSIQALFFILATHPAVQARAQAELDALLRPSSSASPTRLPTPADAPSLPYVRAVVKECLRWHAIVPLGIAHRLIADDVYRGYRIPAGTLVISNIWAYAKDETHYPDPLAFNPERFLTSDGQHLDPSVRDPAEFAFGYGRRVCPGRHFAEASLFLIVASVLFTMDVAPPRDAHGEPIKLEGKMTSGVISYPEPFECTIRPRGPWAEALVRAEEEEKAGTDAEVPA
ncbi:CyP450 monooxygenase [Trametes meyenii]|nr:CyP450 monooxygenase [Trametes meyenii]